MSAFSIPLPRPPPPPFSRPSLFHSRATSRLRRSFVRGMSGMPRIPPTNLYLETSRVLARPPTPPPSVLPARGGGREDETSRTADKSSSPRWICPVLYKRIYIVPTVPGCHNCGPREVSRPREGSRGGISDVDDASAFLRRCTCMSRLRLVTYVVLSPRRQ